MILIKPLSSLKKPFLHLILVGIFLFNFSYASIFSDECVKDGYSNFHATKTFPYEGWKDRVSSAVRDLKAPQYRKLALYIKSDINQGIDQEFLEKFGFEFYELSSDKKSLVWLYRNHRDIPQFWQGCTSAAVLITRENAGVEEVLLVKTKSRKELDAPGGFTEQGEFFSKTPLREIYEEVGIKLSPETLQLVAITNYVGSFGRPTLNEAGIIYKAELKGTHPEITIDPDEIEAYFWIPLAAALNKDTRVEGYKISEIQLYVLQAVFDPSSIRAENKKFDLYAIDGVRFYPAAR